MVYAAPVNTRDLIAALRAQGLAGPTRDAPSIDVSPRLIRFDETDGGPTVAIGGEAGALARLGVVLDAMRLYPDAAKVRVHLGSADDDALHAATRLAAAADGPPEIDVWADLEPAAEATAFGEDDYLATRAAFEPSGARPPPVATAISDAVDDPALAWRPSGDTWAGHVDGLEVAQVSTDGGVLGVPDGAPSSARRRALQLLARDRGPFTEDDVRAAAAAIRRVVEDRAGGRLASEARTAGLIAKLHRGAKTVTIDGAALTPRAASLPTRWAAGGRLHTTDLLMLDGATAWAIEVVVGDGGIDERFRHAAAAAALHRLFLEEAGLPGVDAVRAAVVFPRLTSARGRQRLVPLQHIAGGLGVALAQVR